MLTSLGVILLVDSEMVNFLVRTSDYIEGHLKLREAVNTRVLLHASKCSEFLVESLNFVFCHAGINWYRIIPIFIQRFCLRFCGLGFGVFYKSLFEWNVTQAFLCLANLSLAICPLTHTSTHTTSPYMHLSSHITTVPLTHSPTRPPIIRVVVLCSSFSCTSKLRLVFSVA
jgi:hypothetical protein